MSWRVTPMRHNDPRRILATSLVLAVVASALATSNSLAGENLSARAAVASITAGDVRRHAEVLANDTFEGREAGTRGGRAAAGYLLGEIKRHALKGAGASGGYYQSFGADYRN